ncbi:MAG: N-acetyltransferase family protein, partial [Nitriliruptoraceae bacterium]
TDEPTDEPTPPPAAVQRGEWSQRTQLRDGRPILLRSIRPSDRARLAEGLARLSPASRYLRFHAPIERLSDAQLDYLTQVDHVDHEAIVALDLEDLDVPGIGVGRYIREPYEPTVAEAAITVADAYHGQGAGTILLGALAQRARSNGVEVFRNYVLDGNHAMLEVFDHLGAERELEADGLWRVDLRVPEGEEDVPASAAGRAFLEMARSDRILASILPPLWSRWRRLLHPDRPRAEDEAPDEELTALIDEELAGSKRELDEWLRSRDAR